MWMISSWAENFVFPKTSQWVDANLPEDDRRQYAEYRYNVLYHFSRATQAEEACGQSLRNYDYRLTGPSSVTVHNFNPDEVIRHGDFAIREAASAIDTGLTLTNHILRLDVREKDINWRKDGSLRTALRKLPGNQGDNVVSAIDAIWNSAGYKLFLVPYRHWVTHRGAPRIVVPDALYESQPLLPDETLKDMYGNHWERMRKRILLSNEARSEISAESDPRHREFLIEAHLLAMIGEQVKVRCWPFAPSIDYRYSATIKDAESDMLLPGAIHISEGVSVEIKDQRIQTGSLLDDATKFQKNNRELLEVGPRVNASGEELAEYTARDYHGAIVEMTYYLTKNVLRRDWDRSLSELCAMRHR